MSFTEWVFLFGGLAVIGPVIAHLLAKPRFRRLPFTMLRFLHAGQVESQSRRKLRDLLILLLRCGIIVLIAMLFARPVLHVRHDPKQARSVYCLGLDNSMSMAYSDGDGRYFDKMVDSAIEYVRLAETDALFDICTLASGDWTRGLSREQALAAVKALKIESGSAYVSDFASGLTRTAGAEHRSEKTSVLVLSDFTPHMLSRLARCEETSVVDKADFRAIVSSEPVNNATITGGHVVGLAEGRLTLNATVANYGQTHQKRRLSAGAHARPTGPTRLTGLRLPGGPASTSDPLDIALAPHERRTFQLQLDIHGAHDEQHFLPVELALSEGDGLRADDTFYLGVSIPGRKDVHVLLAGTSISEMFLLKTAMDALSRTGPHGTLRIRQVLLGELAPSDWAGVDVVVCSTIADRLSSQVPSIEEFVQSGGRLICFVTGAVASQPLRLPTQGGAAGEAARQLWQRDLLPALPGRCVRERMHIQPKPCEEPAFDVDHVAARALSNYRIDRILLKGYFECEPHTESRLLWQLQNGLGFVYLKPVGSGTSILVNTSADDSLGLLAKSNASVAFCRYLLGEANRTREFSFTTDERIMLPLLDGPVPSTSQAQLWVETCDGKKHRAVLGESFLRAPDPAGIGWLRTLGKPTIWAGVNLPQGETDMAKSDPTELAEIMDRVFPAVGQEQIASAEVVGPKERKPLWRVFAWALILLLLIEPALANRLRR